eukprot:comp22200_c0_seq1/m.32645 comp22200_c0_seq1/g.32645  ORF comp22200_c0_seq1/g.32645 comp22200_c0_seq1/m.32645 type:complete len:372 (-) comp22200_c0_seq1:143-1258(-)
MKHFTPNLLLIVACAAKHVSSSAVTSMHDAVANGIVPAPMHAENIEEPAAIGAAFGTSGDVGVGNHVVGSHSRGRRQAVTIASTNGGPTFTVCVGDGGMSEFVLISAPSINGRNLASSVCVSYGMELAPVTSTTFNDAAGSQFDCMGPNSIAWVSSWDGNDYAKGNIALTTGAERGKGAINAHTGSFSCLCRGRKPQFVCSNPSKGTRENIGFDDLQTECGIESIPPDYKNLTWSPEVRRGGACQYPGSGFNGGAVSLQNTIFGWNGADMTIGADNGPQFDLLSLTATAAWRIGLQVQMAAFRAGTRLTIKSFSIPPAGEPQQLAVQFEKVDKVVIRTQGGKCHGKYKDCDQAQYSNQVALDNMLVCKYSA